MQRGETAAGFFDQGVAPIVLFLDLEKLIV
jgi:hypothetical protein